ncbi:ABC transporter ATP-binding protein [[Clostridium] hylemonae]|uniref:ABC transporter ATP-binding protein n=1 Tax=[Clostridium] hylemonae TaxID=89153 RepID=UPI000302A245|nr:ABC transporter ATP-binding protein [[Clostridium] hylemonae]QEK16995.1 Oligopeptide transport ATP-binding protein OppD [[Clostridium] hylemonae DSM 15053]
MGVTLLNVEGLVTEFYGEGRTVRAIDHVSFHVDKGEILGVIGESGCGKSVTSMSVMRLIPENLGRVAEGRITFEDRNILKMSRKEFSGITGKEISMIFQEPLSSLNPLLTCGYQIVEAIRCHEAVSRKKAWKKAVGLLDMVGIPMPEKRAEEYPHQLSGGMRQRVMIAMAIACSPKLLIADEPTTALDVTIQAQILDIIRRLREELGMAVMFITHDMGVIAEVADRVMVMYAGSIVEEAPVKQFFANPLHPYSMGLLKAVPRPDEKKERLFMIEGTVPKLSEEIIGCRFCGRCGCAADICTEQKPPLVDAGQGQKVLCWQYAMEGR